MELLDRITKRKNSDYKMQLAIAQNPHSTDPKQLWYLLSRNEEADPTSLELDVEGFERLKQAMSKSGSIVVK